VRAAAERGFIQGGRRIERADAVLAQEFLQIGLALLGADHRGAQLQPMLGHDFPGDVEHPGDLCVRTGRSGRAHEDRDAGGTAGLQHQRQVAPDGFARVVGATAAQREGPRIGRTGIAGDEMRLVFHGRGEGGRIDLAPAQPAGCRDEPDFFHGRSLLPGS